MKHRILAYASLIILSSCSPKSPFSYENGDLLFQVSDGVLSDAIKAATSHSSDMPFTHVGIVSVDSVGRITVIEATYPKVQEVPLADFLAKSAFIDGHPLVAVGRMKRRDAHILGQNVVRARLLVGKDYDLYYRPNNDMYYCSELVSATYLTQDNAFVFQEYPMTFKDSTGAYPQTWIAHFDKLDSEIPEGMLGSNPAKMSNDSVLTIVYRYY